MDMISLHPLQALGIVRDGLPGSGISAVNDGGPGDLSVTAARSRVLCSGRVRPMRMKYHFRRIEKGADLLVGRWT
jgi:hypothetical protein